MRNLERRFFPFLEVEFGTDGNGQAAIFVVSVDTAAVNAAAAAGTITSDQADAYGQVAGGLGPGAQWTVRQIDGDFGPLGRRAITLATLQPTSTGDNRLPVDAWTAARLLVEDSVVTLGLTLVPPVPGSTDVTLSGRRTRYLDETGALARIFQPGELTQSLCSPWTHDFRDCACFYWASNHPDIALPPLPADVPVDTADMFNKETSWERRNRSVPQPPVATARGARDVAEMEHHQINRDWQQLNFVLERRERLAPYVPPELRAQPLPDLATLLTWLRYAAGVELGVMLEYLTAAWSIRRPDNNTPADLRGDLLAAFDEMRRVAIGEMRHLRAVNDVLAHFQPPPGFTPALGVATLLPGNDPGTTRPLRLRAASAEALDDFIGIEAPSMSVDGVYARILVTVEAMARTDEQQYTLRTVMAEGEEHWRTFRFIKDWLTRHTPAEYLRGVNLQPPPAGNEPHATLQQRYRALLDGLFQAYAMGMPRGAPLLNAARASMLGADGIEGALDTVADHGFLAVFDPVPDPRFAPVMPPPPPAPMA
ncbi:MAG: hypothetical protein JOZ11_14100 [Alphaproteobacteria bacterium]|nr:hypothetical protein [Alphaproteobacteria bacterium]